MHPPVRREDPNYLKKADFGKIPKYLKRINRRVEGERKEAERSLRESSLAEESRRRLMSSDERSSLIASLKTKWEEVNALYQQKSHLTDLDTLHKIRRKDTLEAHLEQIETDISLLTRVGDIYVDLEN